MKKKFTMKSLIGNLLFIAVLFLIITRFLTVWSGTAFPVNLISANSMNPTLMEGDIVAWVPTDINDITVGDVIVFKSWLSWPEEKFVVHRVVEIKEAWGNPALVTKGDANEEPDINTIMPEQVTGKVVFTIPKLGWIPIFFKTIFNKIGLTI